MCVGEKEKKVKEAYIRADIHRIDIYIRFIIILSSSLDARWIISLVMKNLKMNPSDCIGYKAPFTMRLFL